MQRNLKQILRQYTGVSPETFQLSLNGLSVIVFFLLISELFSYDNPKSQFHIFGGGSESLG